ncbi:hypothetical protein LEN26_012369 [Aphanomyces euteiches]|nr:hypothetical protein LEN26_012369 [Aphanomyces euteiches]
MLFVGIASIVSAVYVTIVLAFRIILRDIDLKHDLVYRHAGTAVGCLWLSMDPSNYAWFQWIMEAVAIANAFSCHSMIVAGTKFTPVSLDGKVAIVTGANSGIGLETARELARMGAQVIFACRSQKRAEAAIEDVAKSTGSTKLLFLELDLASSKSIRAFADEFKKTKLPLDILVNNAGIHYYQRETTVDGHESMFGINHLGPFLLTNLLLPTLFKSKAPRIVNIGSCMMKVTTSIPFDGLMSKKNFNGITTYCWTKLANYLFTLELHRRYAEKNVVVNCVHPGLVISQIQDNMHPALAALAKWAHFLRPLVQQTGSQGAYSSVFAATSPTLTGGNYIERGEVFEPPAHLKNEKMAKRLWEMSCNLTGWKSK